MQIPTKIPRLLSTDICKRVITVFSLIIIINNASASNRLTEHLKMVGQGEMSWLFIDLYQATFYSSTGEYNQHHYPQALNITYQKNISKDHLIEATNKEWNKLDVDNAQRPQWIAQLNNIWPNIEKGDQLLFMIESDGNGSFYHNNKLLGAVDNQQFSEAFISIWLSKNSSQPALRKQLIGE